MQLPAHLLALIALGSAATTVTGCADASAPDEQPSVDVDPTRAELERSSSDKTQVEPTADGGVEPVADASTVSPEPDSDELVEERGKPFDCPACGLG